jgi:DNA adenine methylase
LIRVITSSRAVSLQVVAMDIVKVGLELKLDIQWFDRLMTPHEIRLAGDSAIITMPVDPLYATPYILLARDLKRGGVRAVYYGPVEGRLNKRHVMPWMREVDFVAVSNYVRDKLLEAGLRVIDVVHHGVDLKQVEQARKMRGPGLKYLQEHGLDPSKHIIVLTIANAHPRKGLAWYDKVVGIVEERDPSIRFLVVTEDRGLNYFNRHSNLVVTTDFGKLPRLTILSLIANSHILAIPSLAEGFGLPALEAMALGTPCVHAELPPLMEFSTCFTVPVTGVSYLDKTEAGSSGIIFESHLWDVDAFADMILQVVDYYRNKRDAIVDYRYKAWLQAKRLSIYRTYPKLLKHFAGDIPDELDDGVVVYEISKILEVPPPIPPVATPVTTSVQVAVATTAASTTMAEEAVEEIIDVDELAEEILSSVGEGKPTKPLPYPGGDWFIKDEIISLLVKSGCKTLVEVFGRSGVISMYAPRDVFKAIIYNDKDELLTNFFMVLKERPQELAKRIALTPPSRAVFNKYLEMYRSGEIHKLDPVEKAVALFYIIRASMMRLRGGFMVETDRSLAKEIRKQASLLVEYAKMWADVTIENKDFRDIIKTYDREYVVFYCDPPFLSYKGKDRERYYRFAFTEDDMRDLLNLLSNIRGKFVLKLPYDHLEIDFIREWVSKYRVKEIEHPLRQYKSVGKERPRFKIILVYNYEA